MSFANLLQRLAADWAAWMVDTSWQVAVVFCVVACVAYLVRGRALLRSARLRYSLWLLVLLRLVLPPSMSIPTGWGWWLRSAPSTELSSESDDDATRRIESSSSHMSGPTAPNSTANRSTTAKSAPQTTSIRTADDPSWSLLLMLCWCGVVIARVGMLFTSWLQVQAWSHRAKPILDPEVLDVLDEAQLLVGYAGRIEVRNSSACATPLVIGSLRPVILLPDCSMSVLNRDELRAVFVHELWHVKRRDAWVCLTQAILGTVYFFHPLIWWTNRIIARLREDACDESSLKSLKQPAGTYAAAIVKVAEMLGYDAPPLALGVLDPTIPAKDRLCRILAYANSNPKITDDHSSSPWSNWGVVIALALVVLPCGPRLNSPWLEAFAGGNVFVQRGSPVFVESNGRSAEPTPLPNVSRENPEPDAVARPRPRLAIDETAIRSLVTKLADPQQRPAVVASLAETASDSETHLLRIIHELDTEHRLLVVEALGEFGGYPTLREFERQFLDANQREQYWYRDAMYRIRARLGENAFDTGPDYFESSGSARSLSSPN